MKSLLTFEEFVNEHYKVEEATDADGFNPTKADEVKGTEGTVKTLADLIPGKEYEMTVDGKKKSMIFQGVTDGAYIFNAEDQEETIRYTEEEATDLIAGAKESSM